MRILPTGDTHLERRRLKEIPTLDESFDILVCAGELWEGHPEKAIQSVVALARGAMVGACLLRLRTAPRFA